MHNQNNIVYTNLKNGIVNFDNNIIINRIIQE